MREFGRVVSVDIHRVGSTLATAATAVDTSLVLDDVADFDEEGGQLLTYYDDSGTETELTLTYTALDDDTATLTLSGATGQIIAEDTPVLVYPLANIHYAQVRLDEDDLETVSARIPHAYVPLLDPGTRDPSEAEAVGIEWDGTEWVLADVLGAEGQRYVASFSTGHENETPRIDLVGVDGNRSVIHGYSDHAGEDHHAQISFGESFDEVTELPTTHNLGLFVDTPDGLDLGGIILVGTNFGEVQTYHLADDIFLFTGYQANGYCAVQAYNDNGANRSFGSGVTYGGVSKLDNVPSSITLLSSGFADGGTANTPTVNDISDRGFLFRVQFDPTSGGQLSRHYVTVGN